MPDHDHSEILYSQIVRQNSNAAILGPSSPFKKLHAVASAALAKNAVEYNLDLSVLLKGARGIGKLTVTRWVAHQLGMHVMEVRIYSNLPTRQGVNDSKIRSTVMTSLAQTNLRPKEHCVPVLKKRQIFLLAFLYCAILKHSPNLLKRPNLGRVSYMPSPSQLNCVTHTGFRNTNRQCCTRMYHSRPSELESLGFPYHRGGNNKCFGEGSKRDTVRI